MSEFTISKHMHGKGQVRIVKVQRDAVEPSTGQPVHASKHFDVEVNLYGDKNVEACYTKADNSVIIATDSQKNTVFILAKRHPLCSKEEFALIVAKHFVAQYPGVVTRCVVKIHEDYWVRLVDVADGGADGQSAVLHHHAFQRRGPERGYCEADVGKDGALLSLR